MGIPKQQYDTIYERYHRLVMYLLMSFNVPVQEQEDLAQEVFFRIHSFLTKNKDTQYHKGWIVKITKNTFLSYQSRLKLKQLEPETLPSHLPNPLQFAVTREQRLALSECITTLPESLRSIFCDRHINHEPWSKIAQTNALHLDTARKRRDKAIVLLQKCLRKKGILSV